MSNIRQRLASAVRRGAGSVQDVRASLSQAAENRARRGLARARTAAEREKIRLQLTREKAELDRELYEALIASKAARAAAEEARKRAGVVTVGERVTAWLQSTQRYMRQPPRKRARISTRGARKPRRTRR